MQSEGSNQCGCLAIKHWWPLGEKTSHSLPIICWCLGYIVSSETDHSAKETESIVGHCYSDQTWGKTWHPRQIPSLCRVFGLSTMNEHHAVVALVTQTHSCVDVRQC